MGTTSIFVKLSHATQVSRSLTRAVSEAVSLLSARTRSPQFLPRSVFEIRADSPTLVSVLDTDELQVRSMPPTLFGLPVYVDPRVPVGELRIVDPRSELYQTIEVG